MKDKKIDIQKKIEAVYHQPFVGMKGTDEYTIFQKWIDEYGFQNIHFIFSMVYSLGHIQGVRDERARRTKK